MRTTFVRRGGKIVEKAKAPDKGLFHVVSDIQPFTTIEGEVISGRRQLREYEQRNGVRQLGNDWPGSERPAFWDRIKQ